ncbi:MAG: DUF1844 domain-containing protein [bacterium]
MTSDIERDNALFVNLVIIFQSAAMQQMGKIMNPLTGKVEKNLEQARYSIDILSMLKEKTRGNLSEDLERLLDSALLQLRMNYVEEAAAERAGAEDKQAPGEGESGEGRRPEGRPAQDSTEGEAAARTEAAPEPEEKAVTERESQAGTDAAKAGGTAGMGKNASRKGAGRRGRKRQSETE